MEAREMAQQLAVIPTLLKNLGSIQVPKWQLVTFSNSISRGPDTHFWTSQASGVDMHVGKTPIYLI